MHTQVFKSCSSTGWNNTPSLFLKKANPCSSEWERVYVQPTRGWCCNDSLPFTWNHIPSLTVLESPSTFATLISCVTWESVTLTSLCLAPEIMRKRQEGPLSFLIRNRTFNSHSREKAVAKTQHLLHVVFYLHLCVLYMLQTQINSLWSSINCPC